MTRVFTDGAEMKDLLFFSGFGTFSPTVETTVYASGSAAYKFAYSAQAAYKTITGISEMYFRERVRIYSSGVSTQVAFRNGANTIAKVTLDTVNRWVIQINGVVVDTSLETFTASTWYCLEVWLKLAAAPNGRFVLKIDGNTICDFTGDTDPVSYLTVDNLYWVQAGGSAPIMYIDDLALNNVAGGADDTWIGGGRITKITPDGNGTTTEWTGSDADDTDNYLLVDEYPKDDDTTYVYEDATATGDLDQYTMTDTYTGAGRTVQRIWAECRARKTSANAATLKIGFDTGASVNTDDVGTIWETYTARCVGAEYTVNPDDAAAWEEADIDALEFVAEVG
jgi:hypothetical protein